jgi:hypothetical protein
MGLYLCVFDDDREIDGIEVGSYADFDHFRSTITRQLEDGREGSKYPVLMLHSDCDGEWAPTECVKLKEELRDISDAFKELSPIEYHSPWQKEVARSTGLKVVSLFDSFIDVDGEPLLERMQGLCDVAIARNQPILFQ